MPFLIIIFLIWRLSLFFIAWLGGSVLAFSPRFPYSDIYLIPSGFPHWLWSFANFDGVHYLTIASQGYSAQFTQVFFPFYPLLINIFHRLVPINPILIGLLISNIFFLLSIFIFHKVLLLDFKKDTAKWTLLFLIVFPTSWYFGSIYTESLFFFLSISAFYLARKKKWLSSAILAGLASATRLTGIFLLPALWWEWRNENVPSARAQGEGKCQMSNVKYRNNYIINSLRFTLYALRSPLSLIPVGLFSYMLYLQINFGDFLYFWHAQPVFGAERTGGGIIFLPQVLWRYFKILTTVSFPSETFLISVLELVATSGAIILLIAGYFKKIRSSYLIFAFLSVVIPTLTGTFSSTPRYILLAFPIFIVLGMLKSRLAKIILVSVFTSLLVILTILFTNGHWVA